MFEKTKHDFKIKISNGIPTLGNESATSTDLIFILSFQFYRIKYNQETPFWKH